MSGPLCHCLLPLHYNTHHNPCESILIHACNPPFNTPVQSPCLIFLISRILKLPNVIITISNHNSLSAPFTLLLQLIKISNPWSSHLHLHYLSYSLTFNLLKYPCFLHLYCSHKQPVILLYPFTWLMGAAGRKPHNQQASECSSNLQCSPHSALLGNPF